MLETRVRTYAGVKNARERVRLAIRRRLDELGITNRAFGRAFSANNGKGHVDTWVSALLKGQFALSLEELDEAAKTLKTTATQLVKSEFEQAEFLSPSEYRLVQAIRGVPPPIRDHLILLAEYLVGVAPEEIDVLDEYRQLTAAEKQRVRNWIHITRIGREALPELTIRPDAPESSETPSATARRSRGRRRRQAE